MAAKYVLVNLLTDFRFTDCDTVLDRCMSVFIKKRTICYCLILDSLADFSRYRTDIVILPVINVYPQDLKAIQVSLSSLITCILSSLI